MNISEVCQPRGAARQDHPLLRGYRADQSRCATPMATAPFATATCTSWRFWAGRGRWGSRLRTAATLLALWEDKSRASADVRQLASDHLIEIEAKIADLTAMRDTLAHLVHCCAGDNRPDCPILKSLGG